MKVRKVINGEKMVDKETGVKLDNSFYRDLVNQQFLVLSSRNEDNPEKFDNVISAKDLETAQAIVKWNYNYLARIVNLETLETVEETRKLIRPTLKEIYNG